MHRVPLTLSLLMTLALSHGCSLDLNELSGSSARNRVQIEPSDAGLPESIFDEVPVAATIPAPSPTSTPRAGKPPPSPTPEPEPSSSTEPSIDPSCGTLGLECCHPDASCSEGACLRGRCTNFAGTFATSDTCSPTCLQRNPYTAGCSCPPGFVDWTIPQADSNCSADGDATDSFCVSPDGASSNFIGAYLRSEGCSVSCSTSSALTSCSCPPGAVSLEIELQQTSLCGANPSTLGLCLNLEASTITFAGAYQASSISGGNAGTPGGGTPACQIPNPLTNQCTCPDGALATPTSLRVGSEGRTLIVCTF